MFIGKERRFDRYENFSEHLEGCEKHYREKIFRSKGMAQMLTSKNKNT